ncbi:MAG TPA: hypothetical protein DCS49_00670 [Gammaproteobacteria bacterium]|nr:hypothetical protein [Gammaproteobacteria bacterium]
MARVIAVMNQHQGVGKTTMTMNLGQALAELSQTVMLIDMVPDADLTGQFVAAQNKSIYQCLLGQESIDDVSHKVADNLTLIPANTALLQFQKEKGILLKQGRRLEKLITPVEQNIILIDTPRQPSLLMLNTILAADEIIIPIQADYTSLQGLVKAVKLFKRLKRVTKGAKLWVAINAYQATVASQEEILKAIQTVFPQRVLKTTVHYHEQLDGSLQSVFNLAVDLAVDDYLGLAKNILTGEVF